MRCTNPITITKGKELKTSFQVGCGKCLACRINKRREWTIRIIQELQDKKGIFVTLTYKDEKLPKFNSLVKSDLQKFIKRLRKSVGKKIKYYAVGEYGDLNQRPHYHAIIMNMDYQERKIIYDNWTLGIVHIGLAEVNSVRYTVQYLDKKYTGKMAETEYYQLKRIPPFAIQSQGIGKEYALKNKERIIQNKYIEFKGQKVSIPRYYLKLYGMEYSDLFTVREIIERDIKQVEKITGLSHTRNQIKFEKTIDIQEVDYRRNKQRKKILEQKTKQKERKL